MISSRRGLLGCALALCLLGARPAFAAPITLDGAWVLVDEPLKEGDFFSGSWDWTSPDAVQVTITDWLVASDRFNVYDNDAFYASLSGGTDWQLIDGCNGHEYDASCHWTNDPNLALGDPVFASGRLFFTPGSHSITIQAAHIPLRSATGEVYADATVALQADEVVPEPSSLLLLGTGCLGVATALRRKFGQKVYRSTPDTRSSDAYGQRVAESRVAPLLDPWRLVPVQTSRRQRNTRWQRASCAHKGGSLREPRRCRYFTASGVSSALATSRELSRMERVALPMLSDARETASMSAPTLNPSRMLLPLNCAANFGGSTEK